MATCDATSNRESNVEIVKENIKSYLDFPSPGIIFRDIFSVYANPKALAALHAIIREDVEPLRGTVKAVCGLDSRGFLIGPLVALQLGIPFIPIRKKGKLPGATLSVKYDLEYGSSELEIQADVIASEPVLIVDDLLATGGTLKAAASLLVTLGAEVKLCYVIMELQDLNARKNIPYQVRSIIQF